MTRRLALAVIVTLAAATSPSAFAGDFQTPRVPVETLKAVIPAGHKISKVLPLSTARGGREVVVGLTDVDDGDPRRTVTLLLVALRERPVVEDSVQLHPSATGGDFSAPNYLNQLTEERVGEGRLILAWSTQFAGGSGSLHYFDLYRADGGKLRLAKSFAHGRMERLYFAVYQQAIYDAVVECHRGEKHGNAYVYGCALKVTRYDFDGHAVVPGGSTRVLERQGNRFLSDDYRNLSVLTLLRKGEVVVRTSQ